MNGVNISVLKNGFIRADIHYTADEKKDEKWKKENRPGYTEAGWRREMEIDFDALSGTLVYPEYSEIHRIPRRYIDIKKLNTTGRRFRVLDHGVNNPTCVLWVWVDDEDNWLIYREYYVAGQTIPFHSKNIKNLSERESYEIFLADPSVFAKNQQAKEGAAYSLSTIYAENGIELFPANNDFKAGSDKIHDKLAIDLERLNPWMGEKGSPSMFFIKEECVKTDWEIRKWRYQEFSSVKVEITKNLKESPIDKDNHAMDCLTYFANYIQPERPIKEANKTVIQKDIDKILNKVKEEENRLEDAWNSDIT